MHEHVGEEAPGPSAVAGVVHEGALHIFGVVGLQHPLVEPGPVAQEHDDLGGQVLGPGRTRGAGGSQGAGWTGRPTWARVTEAINTGKKDVLFIIGDWNAKVGSQEIQRITGKFGLGVQNEAGQRQIEYCQENTLVIANTLFQQHKRRLYTCTSPDGQH